MTLTGKNAGIFGLGSYLPEKILTNFDLEKMVDTSDEWIRTRSGISERRIADENTPTSELACKAAKVAIEDAGISVDEIDLIITATVTGDMSTPSMSCIIQNNLGAKNAAAFDINAACTGFIYGLTIASQFIATGYYKCILVIGTDALSKITDWTDRSTCVLFADGAGAAIIKPVEEGQGILATNIGADGSQGGVLTCPHCYITEVEKDKRPSGNYRTLYMEGSKVFEFAVKTMTVATKEVLARAGLALEDVSLIIPHQANIRIIDGAAKRLKVPAEKIFSNIHNHGNMSAASIPVALHEAYTGGRMKKGDYIVLVGFGGGLTWGSIAIKWNKY